MMETSPWTLELDAPHCGHVVLEHLDKTKDRFMFGDPQKAWAKTWGKLNKDMIDEHASTGDNKPHRAAQRNDQGME